MFKYNLKDNDRATRVFFVQHPREQGEWCNQNPERNEVFGVIIRPAPEQTNHYSHYNTKLGISCRISMNGHLFLGSPKSTPLCFWIMQ